MARGFWGRGWDVGELRSSSEEGHGGLKVGGKGWRLPVHQVSNWNLDTWSSSAPSSPEAELVQLLIQKRDSKGGRNPFVFLQEKPVPCTLPQPGRIKLQLWVCTNIPLFSQR